MTDITEISIGTEPDLGDALDQATGNPSSVPLFGFEPENLIGGGSDNTIYESRRCSIINGTDLYLGYSYNTHLIGLNSNPGFGYNYLSNLFLIYCENGMFVNGDVVAYRRSDERLKDNITELKNCLNKIKKLNVISFEWNDKQQTYCGRDLGLVAQEVEKQFPNLVQTRKSGYKAVGYQKIIPVIVGAIKEQQYKLDKIKEKIKKYGSA